MTCASEPQRPTGLTWGSESYGQYQSSVHSHTLPDMSNSPHRFGGNWPTVIGCPRNLPLRALYGNSPLMLASRDESVSLLPKGSVVPARHANSHSASVGSRKPLWLWLFNCRTNCCTSNQLTFQTRQRAPRSSN